LELSDRLEIPKRAFIDSLPVLMGYSAMGFAAGVLLSAHSGIDFSGIWAFLTSATSISGALQFMLVGWIADRTPLLDVALLTFCLNVRYAMYGFSLLDKFRGIGFWKKLYLIWSLTDETYALETECKIPDKKKNIRYCLLLAFFDHSYWIIGVTCGALAGKALPFSNKGIDFAMTALFLVILTDQCRDKLNRLPALIGGGAAFVCCLIFGASKMLIPSMILMITIFLACRRFLDPAKKEKAA
jgi:4-azaleucine resistance transporter AzlC